MTGDAARFPAVNGKALDGTPFAAPRDLEGTRTIALVGFAIEHRAELESWVPFLDRVVRSRSDVRARLFVALPHAMMLVRGALLVTMRAAVTAPELRASTILLQVDADTFARALGIDDRSHLAVLLVLEDGRIVWRGSGAHTTDTAGTLEALLDGSAGESGATSAG